MKTAILTLLFVSVSSFEKPSFLETLASILPQEKENIGRQCEIVYDDVWEEKCKTLYKDKCETLYVKQCNSVSVKTCETKSVQECSLVLEDKCTTLNIPYCKIDWEELCGPAKECLTVTEQECSDVPQRICTQTLSPKSWEPSINNYNPIPSLIQGGHGHEDSGHHKGVGEHEGLSTYGAQSHKSRRSVHKLKKWVSKLDLKKNVLLSKFEGKKAVLHSKLALKEWKKSPKEVEYVSYPTECTETVKNICRAVPREVCTDVVKCAKSPKKNCGFTPKTQCAKFPAHKCADVPKEICNDVPKQVCTDVPKEQCLPYPEKSCQKLTVKRPREVCYPNVNKKF